MDPNIAYALPIGVGAPLAAFLYAVTAGTFARGNKICGWIFTIGSVILYVYFVVFVLNTLRNLP